VFFEHRGEERHLHDQRKHFGQNLRRIGVENVAHAFGFGFWRAFFSAAVVACHSTERQNHLGFGKLSRGVLEGNYRRDTPRRFSLRPVLIDEFLCKRFGAGRNWACPKTPRMRSEIGEVEVLERADTLLALNDEIEFAALRL